MRYKQSLDICLLHHSVHTANNLIHEPSLVMNSCRRDIKPCCSLESLSVVLSLVIEEHSAGYPVWFCGICWSEMQTGHKFITDRVLHDVETAWQSQRRKAVLQASHVLADA